jgi:hypothetical protein
MIDTKSGLLIELDELLKEPSVDYWSDEGVTIAQNLTDKLRSDDFEDLQRNTPTQPSQWKRRLCECLSHTPGRPAQHLLVDLLFDSDQNVALAAADSLRVRLPLEDVDRARVKHRAEELLATARSVYIPGLKLLIAGLSN